MANSDEVVERFMDRLDKRVFTFGKHEGKSWQDVFASDLGYLQYFQKKCRDKISQGEQPTELEMLISLYVALG